MRILGFSLGSIIRIGIAATLFSIAFKYVAHRSGIPAAERVAQLA